MSPENPPNIDTPETKLQKAERETFEELPLQLGPHGGLLFKDPTKGFDPEYEYLSTERLFTDAPKFWEEQQALVENNGAYKAYPYKVPFTAIKKLPEEQRGKEILAQLTLARSIHSSYIDLSKNEKRDPGAVIELDIPEGSARTWFKYLFFEDCFAHPGTGTFSQLKDVLFELSQEEQQSALEWAVRYSLIHGTHARTPGFFAKIDARDIVGVFLDERFKVLQSLLNQDYLEYLWARDLDDNFNLDTQEYRTLTESLGMDPEKILAKARKWSNSQRLVNNILTYYPELKDSE